MTPSSCKRLAGQIRPSFANGWRSTSSRCRVIESVPEFELPLRKENNPCPQ